jgi:hypothetical protein
MFNNTNRLEFNNDKNEALGKLQQILEEAIDIGADSIELEYADGGLEVCYMLEGMGVGTILADRRLVSEIIELIIDKAKLENKSRGVMGWTHLGKQYKITVEEYENFGESAFRLILRKPKRKAG